MDPANLLGGVLVSATFLVGTVAWNRFWNPVRWHLRYNGHSNWRLRRMTGTKARNIAFRGLFAAPPTWLFTGGDMPVSNVPYAKHAENSLARDQWRDIRWSPDERNFYLEWTEWSGRRRYEFHIFTNTLDIDVRRRDIKRVRAKRTRS